MRTVNTHAGDVRLVGGAVCLDFVNTVASFASDPLKEYLHSYADLLMWARHAAIISSAELRRLQRAASQRPTAAAAVYGRAVDLRLALYRLFTHAIDVADLAVLNAELAAAPARTQLAMRDEQLTWHDDRAHEPLAQILWIVAWSATDLLVSDKRRRVRECAGAGCTWLFFDSSPNRSRRWCSMADCGNRAKARRFYGRMKDKG